MFKQLRLNFTGIFPSAIPSDSMSNLSKILFHSSIGMEEDAFDVKVYVREMARVNMLKKVEIIFVLKQANLFHAQILRWGGNFNLNFFKRVYKNFLSTNREVSTFDSSDVQLR